MRFKTFWLSGAGKRGRLVSRFYKTSDIAKLLGVHPNTVRLYESKGYLSPVMRGSNGYRLFTATHLEQMRLAHLALNWPLPDMQPMMIELVKCAARTDFVNAMELAHQYLAYIRTEQNRAEAAVHFLEQWASSQQVATPFQTWSIGQAADVLNVTADQLRNWDRSGLLNVPRDPKTGYRMYGPAEIGRLRIIRLLRQSGYSVMAILRMLRRLDTGNTENLRDILDTPAEDEGIETTADRWLTTLTKQEQRAEAIIQQLNAMLEAARL